MALLLHLTNVDRVWVSESTRHTPQVLNLPPTHAEHHTTHNVEHAHLPSIHAYYTTHNVEHAYLPPIHVGHLTTHNVGHAHFLPIHVGHHSIHIVGHAHLPPMHMGHHTIHTTWDMPISHSHGSQIVRGECMSVPDTNAQVKLTTQLGGEGIIINTHGRFAIAFLPLTSRLSTELFEAVFIKKSSG